MATKNEVKNETKNQVENPELTQFINEHLDLVPRMWKNRFDSWTQEEKVARIKQWEKNKKNIEDYRERQKLENKVKALFEQKRPTTEEVLKVIEFCKSFIEASKAQEIAKLDEEIQKLTLMKSQLENN